MAAYTLVHHCPTKDDPNNPVWKSRRLSGLPRPPSQITPDLLVCSTDRKATAAAVSIRRDPRVYGLQIRYSFGG